MLSEFRNAYVFVASAMRQKYARAENSVNDGEDEEGEGVLLVCGDGSGDEGDGGQDDADEKGAEHVFG